MEIGGVVMKNFFKQKYNMTDEGAARLSRAVIWHFVSLVGSIFPAVLGFMFISQFLEGSPELQLWQYIAIIVTMYVAMFALARNDYMHLYAAVYDEAKAHRVKAANRLKKLPLSYFGRRDIADLSATIMSDLTAYEEIFSHAVPQLYATILFMILISIMLICYNPILGLAVVWVIPVAYFVFSLSRRRQKKAYEEGFSIKREIIDSLQEGIDTVHELKSYGLEDEFLEEFGNKLDREQKIKISSELFAGAAINIAAFLLKFGIVSVAVVGAHMYFSGQTSLLMLVTYMMLSVSVYNPIIGTFNNLSMLLFLDSMMVRLREISETPVQEGSEDFSPKNYDISFEDVRFSYEDGVQVIDGVTFEAKQGEVTALVGPSGSGKTTLAKLAARFWDIDGGRILLGGENIGEIDPEELLKSYSIVFQDVTLFNASVMDNIRLGKKGATDEEVLRVSKMARCDEFVSRLKDGYNTLVGENGERLSGGERQRISIARAMLKDAPVILLDEATASLDVENESLVQEALSELVAGKTVIIIAHRMRTVAGADKIVVLKDGRIVEMGSPDELMAKGGLFRSMYEMQQAG